MKTANAALFKSTTLDEPVLPGCSNKTLLLLLALLWIPISGCQISYYAHTGYHQTKILWQRVSIEKALNDPRLNEEQKAKIHLATEARKFAETELGLHSNGNYSGFVILDRDAVSYVVQAADAYKLKSYKWSFPFVGEVPYKGYFIKSLAEKEAAKFSPEKYDVWIRGVKAYSTLGWFRDPLTSPMLLYKESDLVETIIHEITHTTIYVKNNAEFNERLATFVGVEGAKRFYRKKEGAESETKISIENEQSDLKVFSQFISEEIESLKQWYEQTDENMIKNQKESRIREMQQRFEKHVSPKLKTSVYSQFPNLKLNNAVLMSYATYMVDLSAFEKFLNKCDGDLVQFVRHIRQLKKSKSPDLDLANLSCDVESPGSVQTL